MHPRISVIIPAYNEEELLPRCLDSLLPQAKAVAAEVLVVDNGSCDGTAEVAARCGARVLHEPRQGYVHALQRGVRAARGDIIAFTDADSTVAPDWLRRIEAGFRDDRVAGLTGPILFLRSRPLTWFRRVMGRHMWGANMAVRAAALARSGGFDTRVNLYADLVLSRKLRRQGRIHFDERLRVQTSSRRFEAQPLRQMLHWGTNYIWFLLFHRPLVWHFDPIRVPDAQLRRLVRRRRMLAASSLTALVFLYFSFWPRATVFGQIAVHGRIDRKLVALTFDDGPNGEATAAIVRILRQYDVPATFFEVGRNVQADPATARLVASSGFCIGNHSWDHSLRLPWLTLPRIQQEIQSTNRIIEQTTGQTPTLFRPPHGWRSPQLLFEVKHSGLRAVDWSVDPRDYFTSDARRIARRVVAGVRPGSIVLLHDGLQDGLPLRELHDRHGTIEALPTIITTLRLRGYTFVTVQELLDGSHPGEMAHHVVAQHASPI